jgi:hypothetical protein
VKTAIEDGDAEGLRGLLAKDASLANALIRWGENDRIATHPLHYVSDMLFQGRLTSGGELGLIEVLIRAGADLNFQLAAATDTPLIGAASLGAEEAGLMLLGAGAKAATTGIFGETALHWAALLGEDRLAAALIRDSSVDLNLKDKKYNSPPLGWAIHGRQNPPAGDHGRQCEVAMLLVAAGARIAAAWLESEKLRDDAPMFAALKGV